MEGMNSLVAHRRYGTSDGLEWGRVRVQVNGRLSYQRGRGRNDNESGDGQRVRERVRLPKSEAE